MRRKNKSYVRKNLLATDDTESIADNPIQVGSQAWYDWLTDHHRFIYEGEAGHLNARKELRRCIGYWYGYRRRDGKLSKVYLGKSEDLTLESLEQACARLAVPIPMEQLSSNGDPADDMAAPNPKDNIAIPFAGALAEASSLPLTKFRPPALPQNLIARPHLIKRINTPVTLICAPSGFGKSTVLNEWRQSCGMQVTWVTLDAEDNNPQRFWSTMVTALQMVSSSVGQNWISNPCTSPSDLSKIVVNLINDVVRVIEELNPSRGIGLVLDNYHHIRNPQVHASLQTFLGHIPPKLNLIIASQTKPPLELGHLRSKGIMVELGIDDLRFTLEEGMKFLSHHTSGKTLAYGDRQKLIKRTEGWITGLVLAVSALAQEEEPSRFIETFVGAHTFLREFFTENVLKRQPPETQIFLLKTSILKHLTGPLCNAVTGQRGSTKMLAHLWEKRLFLQRLEEPGRYRYHSLFAEMLQAQLEEQLSSEIPDLHRRAANWYSAKNAPADAVVHLLAGEAWEEAATLIESVALSELEQSGEGPRLLCWLQQLPEAVLRQHQTLLLLYIRLAMLSLSATEVESFLTRTEVSIAATPSLEMPKAAQETWSEIYQIHRSWLTDNRPIPELPPSGELDAVYQMMDGILQFQRDYRRDLIQAETKASAIYETAQARRHLFGILVAGGACAHLAFSQGHLRRSEQIAHQVLRQAIELRDKLPEPASIALTALSGVYFERNQLAQAHQLLERAIEVDPNPINTDELITMAILRAKIQSIQGDNDAAYATIQAIRELCSHRPSNIWPDQDLLAFQALFRLQQGDLTSAERHLGEGSEMEMHPFSAFVRASILTEQNRNMAAEDILRHLLNQYPHGFYWFPILRVQVKLSVVLFDQHKVNQARQAMAEAARIAAPEFFVRPFLDSGLQFASLLSLVLHTENLNPGTRSFLKETLTMLGYADGLQNILPRDESVTLAIAASITPREQHMLRLLSASLSNQEIAEQCSISSSTVKTHLENIYRKLGVNTRMQAVEQARMLNLV
jgi:LuxR family maltose regulon positive regulatory protein